MDISATDLIYGIVEDIESDAWHIAYKKRKSIMGQVVSEKTQYAKIGFSYGRYHCEKIFSC